MNESFADFVRDQHADDDRLMHAARYYLAERTDDLSHEEMKQEMADATGDAAAVSSALTAVGRDHASLVAASRTLLRWAWDDPAERPRVERAINAKAMLPVIEVAILGMVALYGMYLVTTGGKKSETRRTGKKGGEPSSEVKTEYYPHPLASVVELFRGPAKHREELP